MSCSGTIRSYCTCPAPSFLVRATCLTCESSSLAYSLDRRRSIFSTFPADVSPPIQNVKLLTSTETLGHNVTSERLK